jgi:hypothetical protein
LGAAATRAFNIVVIAGDDIARRRGLEVGSLLLRDVFFEASLRFLLVLVSNFSVERRGRRKAVKRWQACLLLLVLLHRGRGA